VLRIAVQEADRQKCPIGRDGIGDNERIRRALCD